MYTSKPSILYGFHGCDKSTQIELLNSNAGFYRSDNTYDWLGNGMYFWEGNLARATQWAK